MIKLSVHEALLEQVVGYQAPAEEEKESDDYLTTGQTSIAAKSHSEEETAAADTSTRELTQQRQQQLDKDDAVTADDTGRQLQDLLNQKNEGKIRVTKKQLIALVKEASDKDKDEDDLDEQSGGGSGGASPQEAGESDGSHKESRQRKGSVITRARLQALVREALLND